MHELQQGKRISRIFMQDEWAPERYYHVIGKAIPGETLFRDEDDAEWFMRNTLRFKLYHFFEILAYCLCGNHFHLCIRTHHIHDVFANLTHKPERARSEADWLYLDDAIDFAPYVYRAFGGALSGYARRYNIKYSRKGQLFVKPTLHGLTTKGEPGVEFSRRQCAYVGLNYLKHGMASAEAGWDYSSLHNSKFGIVNPRELFKLFGSEAAYKAYHSAYLERYGNAFYGFDEDLFFTGLTPRRYERNTGLFVEGEWRPGKLLY